MDSEPVNCSGQNQTHSFTCELKPGPVYSTPLRITAQGTRRVSLRRNLHQWNNTSSWAHACSILIMVMCVCGEAKALCTRTSVNIHEHRKPEPREPIYRHEMGFHYRPALPLKKSENMFHLPAVEDVPLSESSLSESVLCRRYEVINGWE